MVSILLPINAVWLGFSKERGIVSTYGRNKALIILAQIIWIFINMMGKSSVPVTAGLDQAFIGLKAPALVFYILSIFVLLLSYILKNQYINLVFVAVLLTSIISLYFAHRPTLNAIFISAIFTIFVVAILDISYSLAFYDALTGVLSRRALEQELLKLRNRYSIAMIDLDHFKHINDKFGHDVGDEVLKMVASLLIKTAGHSKVFRYGGEEFVVLFSGVGYNEIIPQLEKMRKAVERRPFILRSDERPKQKAEKVKTIVSRGREAVNVTVSIGVAQKTDLLKTCNDVIRKADEALYKSKNGGRNCVTKS
jgi:diguanylate cyclase (GGDEF)-like protein